MRPNAAEGPESRSYNARSTLHVRHHLQFTLAYTTKALIINKIGVSLAMIEGKNLTQEEAQSIAKGLYSNALPLLPVYSAHNVEAEALIDELLAVLDLPEARTSTASKRRIAVGSFLAVSQQLKLNKATHVYINHSKDYWTSFPAIGHTIIAEVRKSLEAAQIIEKVEGSGKQYFYQDEEGRWSRINVATVYGISEEVLNHPTLLEADWLQTGLSLVQVANFETPNQTYARKHVGGRRTKLTKKKMKDEGTANVEGFWKPYRQSEKQVATLNTYWGQHPLALQDHRGLRIFVGSCTRKFHNGSMQEGGRYYGSYSYLHKTLRYKAKIDGEPVVEVDINACQPTLFSGLMNKRMNVPATWSDLYTEVINNLNLSILEMLEVEDTQEDQRNKMKQVVLELIGTGNPNKTHPAKDCDYTFADNADFGLSEYLVYRKAILETLPALTLLNDTYNKGSASISYHEAEIMTQTLHRLMAQDIPAYSLHDAVIVKEKDEIVAAEVYRNTFRSYIEQKTDGAVSLLPAASIERAGTKKLRLTGSYT